MKALVDLAIVTSPSAPVAPAGTHFGLASALGGDPLLIGQDVVAPLCVVALQLLSTPRRAWLPIASIPRTVGRLAEL